ncbi:cupredoxin domain-containing protein [Alcanivorax sp. S6407]|uniref:cupredoxin domain-containing protein n=1 Tax=Alcanivorax sp. S6407 TaxID=2926424 RepID=UPI001FF1AFCD|nr:cupredoxin domain-containing protein [Alcanivorax sp. S6407]MCK0153700.1 cupredoxin domain-containing protein [Alcanivorax sp. S6407]
MSILINLAGLILIALIIWWFWMSRPGGRKPAAITSETTIIVDDGVYDPALIHARTGQPLTLHFERRDPSPCAEQVIFHGLDVSEFLDNGKVTTVTLKNPPKGEYRFTCQMQMYQGRLIVD